ncbi:MAG: RHS repeat-associated core domain-containing protein, partial [Deltaproteobacteria bacterium]|nr:RHS repeat-associated core domain-containing protein [Deltaproteobacteria bacterium]
AYDDLGRPLQVTTLIDLLPAGGTFVESTSYDRFGRVDQVFDAAGASSAIRNIYNGYGHLYQVVDNSNENHVYYEVTDVDARGTPIAQELSDGVIVVKQSLDPASGRPQILETVSAGQQVQYQEYQWDGVGNLAWRNDYRRNRKDEFSYDSLNRLRTTNLMDTSGAANVSLAREDMTYDGFGNISTKSNVGAESYAYGAENLAGNTGDAGPHALTSAGGRTYKYDDNGSMVESWFGQTQERRIAYTPFNKPEEIEKGSQRILFDYAPDRSRYRRLDYTAPLGPGPEELTTTLYLGNVEKIVRPDGSYAFKRHVGGVIITREHDENGVLQSEKESYSVTDHLGSLDLLLTQTGEIAREFGFDSWGQRRNGVDWTALSQDELDGFDHSITTRGYTGHEMLDEVGIIHMNGRIYDANLGRFLQADALVQRVGNLQSHNRYSYVLNNPLAFSDPSGHFIPALVGIAVYAGTGSVGWTVAAVGGAAFTQTLATGGSFEEAVISGVSSAAFAYIGAGGIPGLSGFSTAAYGFNINNVGLLAAYGTVGGISSSLQGGNFGNGFVSAGISGLVGSAVGSPQYMPGYSGEFFLGVTLKSIVGGTLSEVTGGKFSNGAISTAFVALAGAGVQASKGLPTGQALTDLRVVNCGEAASCQGVDGYALVTDAEAISSGLPSARFSFSNGFRSALFSNGTDYLMTFGGTNLSSLWKDWITTNFAQGLGFKTSQYEMAMGFAKSASDNLGTNLRFAGHSLGGGLASAAAIVTGSRATVFNASGLHSNTVTRHGFSLSSGQGLINAYSSSYDILNVLQDVTPMPNVAGRRFQMGNAGWHSLTGVCGVSAC